MTSETTERKRQMSEFGPLDCERWLKNHGAFVRCGKEEACIDAQRPIAIVLPTKRSGVFGMMGHVATQIDWHNAVRWLAEKLDIPVPWRTDDAPPTEPEGEWSEPVGKWSRPLHHLGLEDCLNIAKEIEGSIQLRCDDDDGQWCGTYRASATTALCAELSSYDTAAAAARNTLRLLARADDRLGSDGNSEEAVWLGDLPMPPEEPPAQSEEAEGEEACTCRGDDIAQCDACLTTPSKPPRRCCLCGAAEHYWSSKVRKACSTPE